MQAGIYAPSTTLCIGFFFFLIIFIYFWLCWVFVSVRGLSPVVASGGHSSSQWAGLSLSRPLLLRSTGSRRAGSVVVAHGPSCSAACGIFPDQGPNPCPLHWQADSQPLRHQGSPLHWFLCLPRMVQCPALSNMLFGGQGNGLIDLLGLHLVCKSETRKGHFLVNSVPCLPLFLS